MSAHDDARDALLESHSLQLDMAVKCVDALVTRIERLEAMNRVMLESMLKLAQVQKIETKAKPKKRKK